MASDYDQMKVILIKIYDLMEDGYCCKYKTLKPETDESPDHFTVRLSTYLMRWVELSETEQSFMGVKDILLKNNSLTLARRS